MAQSAPRAPQGVASPFRRWRSTAVPAVAGGGTPPVRHRRNGDATGFVAAGGLGLPNVLLWGVGFGVLMRWVLLLLVLSSPLLASEIGVASGDGGGWLLLENPLGPGGDGLSPFAGDPGLPVPDAAGWPWGGRDNGGYPATELWRYDNRRYTRATHVLDGAGRDYRRTLYSVFLLNGEPYVLHFDPRGTLGGATQILRATGLEQAGGAVSADAILLNSPDFLDVPAVSPDGRHVVFRAFKRREGGGFDAVLRVYDTQDWALVAESEIFHAGQPVWLDPSTLAVIAWRDGVPRPPQRGAGNRVLESHAPLPGRVLKLTLGDELAAETLLDGVFPPDRLTRTLAADPFGLGLVVARVEGEAVAVELMEAVAEGNTREIARFETFRGLVVSANCVSAAGVRDGRYVQHNWRRVTWMLAKPAVRFPVGEHGFVERVSLGAFSGEPHGGMLDLGRGVATFLEPVVNPDHEADGQPLLRHVLAVPDWNMCDSLRNPRLLARLSRLVRGFSETDIASTLLVYDLEINEDGNQKNGRYVELYARDRRGGRGALRTEDNLAGGWMVKSMDGDSYFDCTDIRGGAMRERPFNDAGRDAEDLLTQLEARKLLMLTGVEKGAEAGGLRYLGREIYREPGGRQWRVWVYEKRGGYLDREAGNAAEARLRELRAKLRQAEDRAELEQAIAEQQRELNMLPRERVILRFVAELPGGGAGVWEYPHALAHAGMTFAMAGGRPAAATDLAFEPTAYVALPDLLEGGNELLLPGAFRIVEMTNDGPVTRLKATAVKEAVDHPEDLVATGKLTPGYNLPGVSFSPRYFTEVRRPR